MNTEPKQVVLDYYRQVWDEARPERIPQFFAEGYVNHAGARGVLRGPAGILSNYRSTHDAFADVAFRVNFTVAEGNRVSAFYTMTGTHRGTFMGLAPTGKAVDVPGIGIYEVRDGLIQESWVVRDTWLLLRQLGVSAA